jgi:protein-L-isoaspartate O-methyltransferase
MLPTNRRRILRALATAPLAAFAWPGALRAQQDQAAKEQASTSDGGPFVPTPWVILDEMLKLAEIQRTDVVFDLGSGDGRLVIAAAKRFGARGVGVERDGNLVNFSRRQATSEGVGERVRFVQADLFETDLREATVITTYLLPRLMPRLVPKLRTELPVGARIVSHDYPLAPWPPDKTLLFDVEEKLMINGTVETKLFYYVVPARIAGNWTLRVEQPLPIDALALSVEQAPDRLDGTARMAGFDAPLREFSVRADQVRFGLLHETRLLEFRGKVAGDTMTGEVRARGEAARWTARRAG